MALTDSHAHLSLSSPRSWTRSPRLRPGQYARSWDDDVRDGLSPPILLDPGVDPHDLPPRVELVRQGGGCPPSLRLAAGGSGPRPPISLPPRRARPPWKPRSKGRRGRARGSRRSANAALTITTWKAARRRRLSSSSPSSRSHPASGCRSSSTPEKRPPRPWLSCPEDGAPRRLSSTASALGMAEARAFLDADCWARPSPET